MDNLVTIIIPVYKEELTNYEKISLERVLSVLGEKYPVCFICPGSLNISKYEDVLKNFPNIQKIQYKRYPDTYFRNIRGYNKLMLSLDFYEQFLDSEYILIYQLDCYIFRDELAYWCNQGYDYIGAPWFTYDIYNMSKMEKLEFFIKQYLNQIIKKDISEEALYYKVGNGGFSLRKVKKFYKVLKKVSQKIIDTYSGNDSTTLYNEDTFWSYEVNKGLIRKLKIPFYKKAVQFSIDPCPTIGMKMIAPELPLGCHAWYKNISFWNKYIKEIKNSTL